MPAAYVGDLERRTDAVHDCLASQSGVSLLGVGAPMAGKGRFAEDVAHRADAADRDVLYVAADTGHEGLTGSLPDGTTVVDCTPTTGSSRPGVVAVSTPADLTGVGMAVSRFVADAGTRPVVALDSLSTLLMYADPPTVFRFLTVLTAQLRRADGLGLFLLDRGCHDQETVATFRKLFDGQVDLESDRARVRGIDDIRAEWTAR